MAGVIYLVQPGGGLVEMREAPYDTEDVLQELLAKYPDLLAGDQIDSAEPRRWLLISREAPLASDEEGGWRWTVDHVFLDQDGIPTFVEVKRSSDTRIRREVIGQMLEYAANAVLYLSRETVKARFEQTCSADGLDPDEALATLIGTEDANEFWEQASTNLQAGRVRLVFVADEIPAELRRIVEFLNKQMNPAQVLAVEIKQFAAGPMKTLVPRVVGQSASQGRVPDTPWDESPFIKALATAHGPELAGVAKEILAWSRQQGLRIWWGRGRKTGSFFPMFDHGGKEHWSFSVWTNALVTVQFAMILKDVAFSDPAKRLALVKRLNEIPGIALPDDGISRYPSFPLAALKDKAALTRFLQAFEWVIQEIKTAQAKAA